MKFLLTTAQAEEFFKRCVEREAVTLEERVIIMGEMVQERRAFVQSNEQVLKRLSGKSVLKLNLKPNTEAQEPKNEC